MQGRISARIPMPVCALCMLVWNRLDYTRYCCAFWWGRRGKEGWGAPVERVGSHGAVRHACAPSCMPMHVAWYGDVSRFKGSVGPGGCGSTHGLCCNVRSLGECCRHGGTCRIVNYLFVRAHLSKPITVQFCALV